MINVLIVDDEPFIRQGLRILINWETYGYHIKDEAVDGEEAIRLLEKNDYDLIITDIKMPNVNGIELIEYIRKNKPIQQKIIVLSGYYEFEYAKQAIRYNVVDYILKPIQKEELLHVLTTFSENYHREIKQSQNRQYTEQMALERHLNALCSGIFDESNLTSVKRKLPYCENLRYISIEMSLADEKFAGLDKEKRRSVVNDLFGEIKIYLGDYKNYVFLDMDKRDELYGIGFIYARAFAAERTMREEAYIKQLQAYLETKQPYVFHFYIGQMVSSLEELSLSFKTAVIAKSFETYTKGKAISYYDETALVKTNAYGIKKEYMDELVRYTEENNAEKIENCVEQIYLSFEKYNIDPKVIHISIDYLLCQFIYIAKELDSDVDQEEIMQYISQCAFEKMVVRGSKKHFKKFVLDFASYLAQLRQNNAHSILKEVEKEVENHYMDNLSLKGLSEKYYINSAYLGQIFKKKCGSSFKDYLNNYRIEKASELLIRTNDKICNIAQSVGYNNLDYFISRFVNLKGKTPLQYRKHFL